MSDDKKQIATIADYQRTFSSVYGKRVLRHLMKVHGFMERSHVDKDPYATAFNEGGRNAIIQIIKKMRVDIKSLEEEIFKQDEGESDVII